ncbi:hypothetical protein [Bordetella hinzii]|uniref:hypothetical protein n=1 Tax=Bordetella hinzii TaxID=103855 RepID=UPI000764A9D2|nr:hypothetical protein [Bordetella hinzii]KXA71044.1 hypothetical protein AXA74_20285 [Bordetella hinzii LMG 13501]VEH23153.1 Uncharacterised protein [Bordetella hinzii]
MPENTTPPALPHPQITPLPNTEPDAVPDLWNTRYQQIDENFAALNERSAGVESELAAAKGDFPSFADRFEHVTQQVVDLGGEVEGIQGTTAPMLSRAVRLDWDYSGNNISLEMWAGDYTLREYAPVAVVSAVAGDDSIDVDDASKFTPGQNYVVFDGVHAEQVHVDAVLTSTRVRVSGPLTYAYGGEGAFLARTSFTVDDGAAQAKAGDAYFSKPINLGFDNVKRAVVIRRTVSAAAVYVDFLIGDQWVSAPLAWTRTGGKVPAGYVDCEYELNVDGDTALRVTVSGGPVEIAHIVGLGTTTGLRGTHTPPLKPIMFNPIDGDENLTDRPTLALTGYSSPTGTAVGAVQFQISATADFAEILVDSGTQVGGLSWREVGLRLETSSTYYARGRARDAEGAWSPWADPVQFSTADSFVYVQAPTNTAPANDLMDVADTPTLQSSAFDVYAGEDTQAAAQWQIRAATGTYDTPVLDSGEDTENLTSFAVPAGVLQSANTQYFFRVRHKGATIGWSDWSVETRFTTKKTFGTVIGIALVSTGATSGQWARIDEDGNAKAADAAFFAAHPTYAGIVDQTIDSQAMVKVPAFYIKTGLVDSGAYIGKKAIWVSDKQEAGFELHPAFKDAGVALEQVWIGKYQGSNATGNKLASVAAATPLVSIDFPTMKSRANARNTGGVTGFSLWNIYHLSAIQMLALIEMGNPDAQTLIGQGNVNSSAALNTSHATVAQATWRGIVGLWGNVWQMVDGLGCTAAGKWRIWDKNGNKTYVATNQTVPLVPEGEYYWPVTMSADAGANYDLSHVFAAATVDASQSNGTYADSFHYRGGETVAYHGGDWANGAHAGLFYLNVHNAASYSSTSVGGRLAKV